VDADVAKNDYDGIGLQKMPVADVRLGLFASFWSLAGRFWSTPISGHISRRPG
jgi:hypothetical protein